MAKLPYMQFYPADYQADVRRLAMATQGAWMQMLCVLWRSSKRGQQTLNLEEWGRELGCPASDVSLYLMDLEHHKVGKISREIIENVEQITVSSPRIIRDKRKQALALKRKQKQRDEEMSRSRHAPVTPMSQQSHAEESEFRSQNQISEVREDKKEERKKKSSGQVNALPGIPKSAFVWKAYSEAYQARYGIEPVRNRQTNALLCLLVDKLGEQEAPLVASFYLSHNNPFYVAKRHPPNLLLQDAEGLRTQWATGVKSTTSEVKHAEFKDNLMGKIARVEQILSERRQA